jgi:ribose-phosphate pyrophosphokinase
MVFLDVCSGGREKRFADTESLVSIEKNIRKKIAGEDVVLRGKFSLSPGELINDQIISHLLHVHQIKQCNPKKIIFLNPYLPYSRQVRGGGGPFHAVGLMYKSMGVDEVIACELHEIACMESFSVPIHEITLEQTWQNILLKNFAKKDLEQACFLSPDNGGIERVERLAKRFNACTAHAEKERVGPDKSVVLSFVGNVKERTVVLVDDIIDTGATAINAAESAIKHGAKRVVACFAHPVLSEGAVERIEKSSIEKVWVCNTLILDEKSLGKKIKIVTIDDLWDDYVRKSIRF